VDGAFGLRARASAEAAHLAAGVEEADSWTTDGHKWLNTPYDGAMAVCRNPEALAQAMNSDAVYATAGAGPLGRHAQTNLTLEFSRRARGVPVWAALRTLGRDGVAAMVDRHRGLARRLAGGRRAAGYDVVDRVVLNQVLVRAGSDEATLGARAAALADDAPAERIVWFGATVWRGRPAFRLSVSSWRTTDADVDALLARLAAVGAR
jgi:aromatic-L-amino-acid decarboxylase